MYKSERQSRGALRAGSAAGRRAAAAARRLPRRPVPCATRPRSPRSCHEPPPGQRADLPAPLPADQGPAGEEPRGRRVAPGRGDRLRARARRALRRLAGHRAQGHRRARRRQPRRAPPGQGHVRRDPHGGGALDVPLPAHPPRRRRGRVSREPAGRRPPRARPPPRPRGCSSSSPATRSSCIRRILEWAGTPAVLDDITLPAALFRGLTRAKLEAYHGSMYGFFETAFGVRMLSAQERLKAVAADAATAALLGVPPGDPAARGRPRGVHLRRAARWSSGAACARRGVTTTTTRWARAAPRNLPAREPRMDRPPDAQAFRPTARGRSRRTGGLRRRPLPRYNLRAAHKREAAVRTGRRGPARAIRHTKLMRHTRSDHGAPGGSASPAGARGIGMRATGARGTRHAALPLPRGS